MIAQVLKLILRLTTTNATPAFLVSSGTSAPASNTVMTMPNNSCLNILVKVVARSTGTGTPTAMWTLSVLAKRGANASSTSILSTTTLHTFAEAGLAAAAVAVQANTTLGAVVIQVTGIAATVDWVADMEAVQLSR